MIHRLSQVIDRPVQEVFATVVDAGNYASWNPTIKSSRGLTPGEARDGSEFEWELRGFGKVRQRLEEFDRDHRVRLVPRMRSLGGGHRFTFADLGGKTRVDHELEMIPKGLFKFMGPLITRTGRANLLTTAEALKRHLEEGRRSDFAG